MERKSTVLRRLLDEPRPIVVPCAYDCVSARIVEMAGFPSVMHGGFNTAASLLGIPDVGVISMSEMIEAARHMAEAVNIPVIADVDDGFGKPLNVVRTVEEAIKSGLGGVYMEDQLLPKRCPSLGGGGVVTTAEMVKKLHAARRVSEERDPDFVIIARTHSSLAVSFEEALKRGVIYAQEGADLIWVDLGYDETVRDEVKAIVERIAPHAPVVANMTENVGRPMWTTDELFQMGFKLITYPITLILTAAQAMKDVMETLAKDGTTRGVAQRMMPVSEFRPIVKMDRIHEIERQLEDHD